MAHHEESMKLKPGDTVRVVGERGTAKIRAVLTTMHGAWLEKHIGGFRNWNLDELRLVKRG
jgi:anaerobic selenocysteine-containing dehydrogenase